MNLRGVDILTELSILCVTKAERHTWPFLRNMEMIAHQMRAELVVVADGETALRQLSSFPAHRLELVNNTGPSLEGVLDKAISHCSGRYILRLDDDETCSQAMKTWLHSKAWLAADHWSFPRVHFWQNAMSIINTKELYPDLQTRLSLKEMAGGRTMLHSGSPFGFGSIAPCAIEHYKFIVKSLEERKAIAERYDKYHIGFGTGIMLPYTLPELAYKEPVELLEYCTGAIPWRPVWSRRIVLGG